MPPYREAFAAGTSVRIASRPLLEQFRARWRYHHPLDEAQLSYGDQITTVKEVAFYHGGDPLYTLDGIPGIWHEECLGPGPDGRAA